MTLDEALAAATPAGWSMNRNELLRAVKTLVAELHRINGDSPPSGNPAAVRQTIETAMEDGDDATAAAYVVSAYQAVTNPALVHARNAFVDKLAEYYGTAGTRDRGEVTAAARALRAAKNGGGAA